MEQTILTAVVLPLSLAFIMFGMGLSLTWSDFKNIGKQPKAALIGGLCQLLLLPLLAFGVASLFGLKPVFAIGLIVVALCPGGVTSNAITFLARGDVALSVSLTALSSAISPFLIPVILGVALRFFPVPGVADGSFPILETIGKLLGVTLIPVGIGMAVRARWTAFATRSEKMFRVVSSLVLLVIIAGIIRNNWENIASYLQETAGPVLALNLSAMGLGILVAKVSRLNSKQILTIGIEVGIQNGTTALVITGSILQVSAMSIPPAVYSLLMFFTGAGFVFAAKNLLADKELVTQQGDV